MATAATFDITKCEKEITNYIQKHILSNKILTNELGLRQWDQTMINAFYKYCLNRSVLPNIDLNTNSQIKFIGSIINVAKAIEKYKLMTEIFKEKSLLKIPPPVIPRASSRTGTRPNPIDLKAYNVYFSYCQHDQELCHRISSCLIGEGYFVCETPSDKSRCQSLMDKSDVILVGFNEKYSDNQDCKVELNYAMSSKKKLIPFVIRDKTEENSLLASLTVAELFYDLFDTEIEIEFNDDFDLEYDKFLTKLVIKYFD